MQMLTMLNFSFNGTLQNNDCTELVQNCIVFTTVGVLHTARTAAGRFAVAVLYQLQCFFKQNREQRGCLHTCKKLQADAAKVGWLLLLPCNKHKDVSRMISAF